MYTAYSLQGNAKLEDEVLRSVYYLPSTLATSAPRRGIAKYQDRRLSAAIYFVQQGSKPGARYPTRRTLPNRAHG